MAKVLVAGATGYLGSIIAEQLARAQVETSALVRGLSDGSASPDRKAQLDRLQTSGVKLIESKLDDTNATANMLQSFNTVVSAISGPELARSELALVKAAQQAGSIKLFIPSQFGGDYPIEGPHAHLYTSNLKTFIGGKDVVLDALRHAGITYTKVVTFGLYGFLLPAFGTFTPANSPSPSEGTIYGDGTAKGAGVAEKDIGTVIARAVTDSRVLNKKLIIKANTFTQADLISAYSQASGKQVSLNSLSAQDVDAKLAGASGFPAFALGLYKAIWIDGLYGIPESELSSDPPVYAADLYPDIRFQTPLEYYKSRV